MSWFNKLTERQIAKARAEGKLTNLQGEGKPLPDRPGDAHISPGDAIGFRIMAEAGVLPEEITLKKQAAVQRTHLATLTDPADRNGRTGPARNAPGHYRGISPQIPEILTPGTLPWHGHAASPTTGVPDILW